MNRVFIEISKNNGHLVQSYLSESNKSWCIGTRPMQLRIKWLPVPENSTFPHTWHILWDQSPMIRIYPIQIQNQNLDISVHNVHDVFIWSSCVKTHQTNLKRTRSNFLICFKFGSCVGNLLTKPNLKHFSATETLICEARFIEIWIFKIRKWPRIGR